jgi:hypothetical protein
VSFIQMTKSLMPGLVYASGVLLGTEKYSRGVTLNMLLIAFGVVVCAIGEMNLVFKGVAQQLTALGFEVSAVSACGTIASKWAAVCSSLTSDLQGWAERTRGGEGRGCRVTHTIGSKNGYQARVEATLVTANWV